MPLCIPENRGLAAAAFDCAAALGVDLSVDVFVGLDTRVVLRLDLILDLILWAFTFRGNVVRSFHERGLPSIFLEQNSIGAKRMVAECEAAADVIGLANRRRENVGTVAIIKS